MEKYTISNLVNTYASDALKLELKERVADVNEIVYNPCYTDYGGSFMDRVLIEWAKKYHPNDIVFENTSWGGQNAFIFGDTAKELPEDFYNEGEDEISELYSAMESEMIEEALNDIMCDYDFSSFNGVNNVRSCITMALYEYGSPQPNMWDYYTPDIIKCATKYLKEEDGIEIDFDDYKA